MSKNNIVQKLERGSTAFFVSAVVLPLMFFLFTISVDFHKYLSERQRVQQVLDDAALYAYRFLPFTEAAASAAKSRIISAGLESYGDVAKILQVNTFGDSLVLNFKASAKLMFATYFVPGVSLPLIVNSRARGTVFNAAIAMDVSGYLAPDPQGRSPWGDETEWPAANFFSVGQRPELEPASDQTKARVYTQQCFGPGFLGVKRTAIRVFDYFSSFSGNAIGLAVVPGEFSNYQRLRAVTAPGEVSSGEGEAAFVPYSSNFAANDWCAAAAENEIQVDDYRFPVGDGIGAKVPVQTAAMMVTPGVWSYNQFYQAGLRARESLWSQAARTGKYFDTPKSIAAIRNELVGASSATRSGLINSAINFGVIISGDLPRSSGKRFPDSAVTNNLLREIRSARSFVEATGLTLILSYLIVIPPSDSGFQVKASEISALNEIFVNESHAERGDLRLLLFAAKSEEELSGALMGYYGLLGKTAVLSE